MGNFGGLTAFYVRLLASRCMPAEPAPASGVGDAPHQTFSHQSPMHEKDGKA